MAYNAIALPEPYSLREATERKKMSVYIRARIWAALAGMGWGAFLFCHFG